MTFDVTSISPCVSQGNTRQFGRRIWQFIRSHLGLFFQAPLQLVIDFQYRFTNGILKYHLACVAVVSFSFPSAKSEREMGARKRAKKKWRGGRGEEGKETPAADPTDFSERPSLPWGLQLSHENQLIIDFRYDNFTSAQQGLDKRYFRKKS